jgi:uncharacterized membrane protein YidH (DUF202 family)
MNQDMKKIAINYALISAGIGILYTLIGYITGSTSLFTTWYIGLAIAAVGIVITVLGTNKYKGTQDGYMSFKDAFTVSFLILFLAGLISTVFNILMFNVIDPGFADELNQAILESTVGMMERMGAPEETITQQIETMESKGGQFSFGNQIKGFGMALIFYGVLALIIAAFTKKKAPEFMDAGSTEGSED